MKRIIYAALTLAVCVCLASCSNKEAVNNQISENKEPVQSAPEQNVTQQNQPETKPEMQPQGDNSLAETYWTSSGHYTYISRDKLVDWSETTAQEGRFADLYLSGDGTALFRDVIDNKYVYGKHYTWTAEEGKLHLVNVDEDDWGNEFYGEVKNGVLYFEAFENILHMEQTERPLYGSEYCVADVYGSWKAASVQTNDGFVKAKDLDIFSCVSFEEKSLDGTAVMIAHFEYKDKDGNTVTVENAPLAETEVKNIKFSNDDESKRFEVEMTDDNTLSLTLYDYENENTNSEITKLIYKRYPVKEQFSDRAEGIDGFYDGAISNEKNFEEKENLAYKEYIEWETLLNDINKYLKKNIPSKVYDGLQTSQIAWVLNRQKKMDDTAAAFKGTNAELTEKYLAGSDITKQRCIEFMGYIE